MLLEKLINKIIVILLLLEVNFFYIIPLPESFGNLNSATKKYIIIFIIILTLCICSKRILKINKFYFLPDIIFFIVLYIFEIIYSHILYNQSFFDGFRASHFYIVVLFYFVYAYVFRKTKDITKIQCFIICITLILSVLYLIQFYLYNFNIIFLNVDMSKMRFNTIRIYENGDILVFSIIIAFSNLIKAGTRKKYKIILFANILFGVLNLILVIKWRIGIVATIVAIVTIIVIKYKQSFLKLVISTILTIIILVISLNTTVMKDYLNSFNNEDVSINARQFEINFYLSQLKEYPLFGVGFIRVEENQFNNLSKLVNGNDYFTYYKDDVGFIGFINTFGIIGGIWYIVLIMKCLYVIIKNKRKKMDESYELIGIFIYLVLTSNSAIIMNAQRIMILPIILSIFDYAYFRSIKKEI